MKVKTSPKNRKQQYSIMCLAFDPKMDCADLSANIFNPFKAKEKAKEERWIM